MPARARDTLSGWGNYPASPCRVSTVETPDDLRFQFLGRSRQEAEEPAADRRGAIARGLGRSYADQATNADGAVFGCRAMDRYLAFDPETACLTCESGVSLEQIIEDFGPHGYFPKITPGTKFVTVGGCIANDIHGKAHHHDGTFVNCVRSMTILLASGEVVTASRDHEADLFWATFGGLGLLGIVLSATIELRRIPTTWFRQRITFARNLEEMLAAIDENEGRYPYSVATLDAIATGKRLGRGVLVSGDIAQADELPAKLRGRALSVASPPAINIPFRFPSHSLNPVTIRPINAAILAKQRYMGEWAHYEGFIYPLDMFRNWNRGYGRLGFTQYQFVVPMQDGHRHLRRLLEAIAHSGQLPFLNILKTLGDHQGMLSFPTRGYTFAIDFPIRPGLDRLLSRLDAMVIEAGGRVYLGKDAFLSADNFRRMYGELVERWLEIKSRYDPDNRFSSDIGRRLELMV